MYRWWTVFAFRDRGRYGVKLGPVSIARYGYDPYVWWTRISVFGRRVYDSGINHQMRLWRERNRALPS